MYNRSRGSKWQFTTNGKVILIAILISAIIGIDIQHNLSFQIFSILSALIIIGFISSPKEKGQFNVSRNIPSIATVDVTFKYLVEIENISSDDYYALQIEDRLNGMVPSTQDFIHFYDPFSLNENWFDRVVGFPKWARLVDIKMGGKQKKENITSVHGKQKVKISLYFKPLRRGYVTFDHLIIGLPDVLGIVRRFQKISCSDMLLVYPKTYQIPQILLEAKQNQTNSGITLSSSSGDAKEFHGLRDYRAGDSIKHIHWRSWARKGYPIVKTFEQERDKKHALILDTYAIDVTSNRFEDAVSIAASFSQPHNNYYSPIELFFVQRQHYHLSSGYASNDHSNMLEVFACVEPDYISPFSNLEELVFKYHKMITSLVCIFLKWDEERRLFIESLQHLGIQVLILVIDQRPKDLINNSKKIFDGPLFLRTGHIEDDLSNIGFEN